jgi:hypothetical protein
LPVAVRSRAEAFAGGLSAGTDASAMLANRR